MSSVGPRSGRARGPRRRTALARRTTSWRPLITPGIVAAGLFGFTLSYDEFARTTLLAGEYNTLPLDINASMTQRIRPTLFALGTASTLFSLLMIGLFLVIYTVLARRTR